MAHPTTLLLTRAQTASDQFAEQVQRHLGPLNVVISPLLRIEYLDIPVTSVGATLVFISRNGVEAWSKANLSTGKSCYCVGPATGEAARAIGFEPMISGGTVAHLIEDIQKTPPKEGILHIRGRHTRGDLITSLRNTGIIAQDLIVYEQHALDLTEQAVEILKGGEPVIVPLFSPRTAAQFAKAGSFGPQVDVIAISEAAANLCPGARIAPSPDAAGMIAAISQRSMS